MRKHEEIPATLIAEVCELFAASKPIRRALPGGGRLNIDRLLPFLFVYRRDPRRRDTGTWMFVHGEASYLTAPGAAPVRKGLRRLVRALTEIASTRLGAFAIVEVWAGPDEDIPRLRHDRTGELLLPSPAFIVSARLPSRAEEAWTIDALRLPLEKIKIHRRAAGVEVRARGPVHPPALRPLLTRREAEALNCSLLGLEILPVYRGKGKGDVFPQILRRLQRGVGRALKRAVFTFSLHHTNVRPHHYYSLGRRNLAQSVWEADRRLAEASGRFRFLLQVTPVNAMSSWHEFEAGGCEKAPALQYRPLGFDPLVLKRRILAVPTERIVDSTLSHILRQTQDELDRQVNMLQDIGSASFLAGSLQVFGGVEPSLLSVAVALLDRLPGNQSTRAEREVDAARFKRHALEEVAWYRQRHAGFTAKVKVRDDMYSGLLVSAGELLIGRETKVSAGRVEALLHHEVGTHLVTYYNARVQPLRLLSTGLAGYDGFQEGLAVLSEYLCGGLTRSRLRVLAARVVATDRLIRGSSFPETFRLLVDTYRFDPQSAYTITLRVYRGGGLTKDAVYLRGLIQVLDYLRGGGDLEVLVAGKLARDHVPVIRELLHREVLRAPPLRPRFLESADFPTQLERLRSGVSVMDLVVRATE